MKWLSGLFFFLFFIFISPLSSSATPVFGYKIIHIYPHDPKAYTQGLVLDGKSLYEGTGLSGASSLRRVDLKTGKILKIRHLAAPCFGEGITIVGNRIIQLTWRCMKGFVYYKTTFRPIGEFSYGTEGWGITYDGLHLIMSDGTDCLWFLDPNSFRVLRTLKVASEGRPVSYLNELEYIRGEIYANIWGQDVIVRISPETGQVLAWIDLAGLRGQLGSDSKAEVLNGIAYRADRKTLLVTGKYWPKLFEIELMKN